MPKQRFAKSGIILGLGVYIVAIILFHLLFLKHPKDYQTTYTFAIIFYPIPSFLIGILLAFIGYWLTEKRKPVLFNLGVLAIILGIIFRFLWYIGGHVIPFTIGRWELHSEVMFIFSLFILIGITFLILSWSFAIRQKQKSGIPGMILGFTVYLVPLILFLSIISFLFKLDYKVLLLLVLIVFYPIPSFLVCFFLAFIGHSLSKRGKSLPVILGVLTTLLGIILLTMNAACFTYMGAGEGGIVCTLFLFVSILVIIIGILIWVLGWVIDSYITKKKQ